MHGKLTQPKIDGYISWLRRNDHFGMRKGLRLLLSAKKHDVLACEMLDSRFGAVTRWISRVNHKFHDFLAFSS